MRLTVQDPARNLRFTRHAVLLPPPIPKRPRVLHCSHPSRLPKCIDHAARPSREPAQSGELDSRFGVVRLGESFGRPVQPCEEDSGVSYVGNCER